MSDENRNENANESDDANENDDGDQDDPLAGLDPQARRLVDRANNQAATRRRELASVREQLDARDRELQELRQAHESEQEKAVREAEERGALQATQTLAPRLLEADLAIAAAGRLRDPQDAAGLLPRETLDALLRVEETSERRKLADAAIADLLEAKPYLATDDANGSKGGGLVTQGGRSGGQPTGVVKSPDEWLRGSKR